MIKRILYDLQDKYTFADSIAIMEADKSARYNLIIMILPLARNFTDYKYNPPQNMYYETDVWADFIAKCIENAYRLLTDDGLLVLISPKTPRSCHEYFIPLNQLFPSIEDILYFDEKKFTQEIKTVYFCSKAKNFCFKPFGPMKDRTSYLFSDQNGYYHYTPLHSVDTEEFTIKKIFEWHGINIENTQILHMSDQLQLFTNPQIQNRILTRKWKRYFKIYRTEECLPNLPVWKEEFKDRKLPCPPQRGADFLTQIIFTYCKPGDFVFCPFDYDGLVPKIATKYNLSWKSIKSNMNHPDKTTWDLSNIEYTIVHELPKGGALSSYHEDLIINSLQIKDMQYRLQDLENPLLETRETADGITVFPELNTERISEILKNLRNDNELSVTDIKRIFEKAGINLSRQTIYNWENGTFVPSLDHLVKLAALYGVNSLDYIVSTKYSSTITSQKESENNEM